MPIPLGTVFDALILLFPALLAIGGGWLAFRVVSTRTTWLWKATGLLAAASLLSLGLSGIITLSTGCLEASCAEPWSVKITGTLGWIGLATAVLLAVAAVIDQYFRTWRRS